MAREAITEERAKEMKLVFPSYVRYYVKRNVETKKQVLLISFVNIDDERKEARNLAFGGTILEGGTEHYTSLSVELVKNLDELNAQCDHWHAKWCD